MPGRRRQLLSYSFLFTFRRSLQGIITAPLQIVSFADTNCFVRRAYGLVHRKDNSTGAGKNLQLYVFLRRGLGLYAERHRASGRSRSPHTPEETARYIAARCELVGVRAVPPLCAS